mmetsp:Transcript_3547/g.8832  ORF Transcript_3547/g.8832 Transcript_3547/m.8832 type:complete len:222 (-) Transcript_3547:141-806(-)
MWGLVGRGGEMASSDGTEGTGCGLISSSSLLRRFTSVGLLSSCTLLLDDSAHVRVLSLRPLTRTDRPSRISLLAASLVDSLPPKESPVQKGSHSSVAAEKRKKGRLHSGNQVCNQLLPVSAAAGGTTSPFLPPTRGVMKKADTSPTYKAECGRAEATDMLEGGMCRLTSEWMLGYMAPCTRPIATRTTIRPQSPEWSVVEGVAAPSRALPTTLTVSTSFAE